MTRGHEADARRSSSTAVEPASTHNHKETIMQSHRSHWITALAALLAAGLAEATAFAQGVSPWLNAVDVLQQAFTGPLARGLSLIAIVIGGLMFAFGEGGSKKALAGIIFGLGMAMGAANFLTWLFS